MSRFFPHIPIIISRNYKSRHHGAVHVIKHRVPRCLSFFTKPECVVIYYRENIRVILSPLHFGKTCKKIPWRAFLIGLSMSAVTEVNVFFFNSFSNAERKIVLKQLWCNTLFFFTKLILQLND